MKDAWDTYPGNVRSTDATGIASPQALSLRECSLYIESWPLGITLMPTSLLLNLRVKNSWRLVFLRESGREAKFYPPRSGLRGWTRGIRPLRGTTLGRKGHRNTLGGLEPARAASASQDSRRWAVAGRGGASGKNQWTWNIWAPRTQKTSLS